MKQLSIGPVGAEEAAGVCTAMNWWELLGHLRTHLPVPDAR